MANDAATADRQRLTSLDGFRGVLIGYVMLYHAHLMAPIEPLAGILNYGFFAVNLFFLLSGFMLMRSFLRKGCTFEGGLAGYLRRRMLRLCPPYYAGLALAIVVAQWIPFHMEAGHAITQVDLSWKGVLLHVFALQNFFPAYLDHVNNNYWYFAMAIQLSLLFPLIALAWRRWGSRRVLAASIVACAIGFALFGMGTHTAKVQFVALFIAGMWTAHAHVTRSAWDGWRAWPAVVVGGLVCLAVMSAVYSFVPQARGTFSIAADTVVGAIGVGVVMLCVSGRSNAVRSVLSLGILAWVGRLSYAAFLLHTLVFRILQYGMVLHGAPFALQFAVLVTAGIGCTLLLAVPFRFLSEEFAALFTPAPDPAPQRPAR